MPLPPLTSSLSRRAALFGAVTVAGATAAAAGYLASASPEAALIAQADALRALRAREQAAWDGLTDADPDGGPAHLRASALSADVLHAGENLAEVPAGTATGLGAKASAMLALVGRAAGELPIACEEHHRLVGSILRDAVRLGAGSPGMTGRQPLLSGAAVLPSAIAASAALPAPVSSADRRLAAAADTLDALQARADRNAAGAGPDPADPYTQAVAEMDLVAARMAMMPADTMAGVSVKLRAMRVPIVRDDDEAHGLALSVCRDLRRLQATGALS